ncbi:Protein kinase protein with adenine nucleotide alpha hydrolases-like domain [Striga hermonthica]|uniref:RING-type E3 ubiquitin transferase n=1 Tax=Striga hermonthica TaxID=68872 RepID=A0A9N7NFG2_STRHE|nr:Protein kinase protein with adenine nucleotide alpha hydrolases-like domain [Striga hermonthica]
MWLSSSNGGNKGRRGGRNGLVAVAIDKDKGSQNALKWACENLITRGQTVILIHVIQRSHSVMPSFGKYAVNGLNGAKNAQKNVLEKQTKELLLTFHCYCTRKDIQCLDVVLEDTDVAKAISECMAHAAIENLVLGASRHGFIKRMKTVDIPTKASKAAPDFCTVYVISKTKISSVRNASRLAPFVSPLLAQIQQIEEQANKTETLTAADNLSKRTPSMRGGGFRTPLKAAVDDTDFIRTPFSRGRGYNPKMFGDLSELDTDISFVSSDRDRTSTDRVSGILFDSIDSCRTPRVSLSSESSYGSMHSGAKGSEYSSFTDFSTSSVESDDAQAEMRRLKLELQRTMEMYSTACKAALTAEQKAMELHRWREEEERRLEEARLAEESARLTAEQEKAKYKAALENAEKRVSSETKASEDSDEKAHSLLAMRYRRYTIDEIEKATEFFAEKLKVGEGGYGPVYKCHLDHTPVAVKVLRPDAVQGRSQFNQEVEILSCMRHPNMVLLLGACPEYGCLVYEYMSNGSLEDRLFRHSGRPPLTWQLRFRIAAEVATGLHFLHQAKPEPLVHRDLKPGNILLDNNFVPKIGDVGLARLVPPSYAASEDSVHLRMTSAAGTFCYIDPEYQQTGMLGVKSDLYSFGIILLQLLTAKPAMGLAHHVGRAVERRALKEVLDPEVPDWPEEEAMRIARLGLRCAEMRRKDRPDLGKVVLPELIRLREFAEENMGQFLVGGMARFSVIDGRVSTDHNKVMKSEPKVKLEYSTPKACLSTASLPDNLSEAAE